MKNKKIIFIGIAIILICLLLVVLFALFPYLRGYFIKKEALKALRSSERFEYIVINDNGSEGGGEYIEYGEKECRSLALAVADSLEKAEYKGTRENFLGGFCLVFRASYGGSEITLWIYEDKIEIAGGAYVSISETKSDALYKTLLQLTK